MSDRRAYLTMAAIMLLGLASSYGLARLGEPQSMCLWCMVGRLC